MITILQFHEGLSDRAEALRGRIDWEYPLCLKLNDPSLDYLVLCEFRARLLKGGAEGKLFGQVLSLKCERTLIKARTQ